jgi:hypothetical protein
MKINNKVILGVLAAGAVVGGLAWGTPIVNLASPLLSTGTQSADLDSRGEYEPTEFKAFLKTEGPSTVVEQIAAYTATGVNGWHSHAGIVIVTLTSGSIDWYDSECKKTTYKAGDTWSEGSQVHSFRVTGTTGVQLVATFIISKGSAVRIDQPAPPCAVALGLD